MRVAFLSPSVSRAAGGIFEIEKALALSLANLPDTEVEVFGLEDDFSAADASSWNPLRPRAHRIVGPRAFGYSPSLARDFLASDADVAHLHSLWMYTSLLVHRWATRHRKPFMTTLNGMLDPWALGNSAMKKKIAALVYERNCLEAAACIQVNSEAELRAARDFGLKGPVCVIPNGATLPDLDPAAVATIEHPIRTLRRDGAPVVLYLGRLHPKKGLANLLDALALADGNGDKWVLAIAGWDQLGHEQELRARSAKLGLGDRVIFLGPQFGDAKTAAFHHADAFILPSYSEGLPMAILEAWSYGKPVLMSPACNLGVGYEVGAALPIDPNPQGIADGLSAFFAMSDYERAQMGTKGRRLVETSFHWPNIARQMRAVYEWMCFRGQAPDFVVFN
jgi:poly(glycerol-phosphate) alpha-glucosyltransferase